MTEKGPSQNLQAILAARGERRVWLRVRIVLDGVATTPLRDVHVVYDNRKILFVGGEPPARLLRPGQWKPDAHLPNYTALPGLIEAHAHLFLEGGELDLPKRSAYLKQTSDGLLAAARRRLEKLVQLGVMAVRDAGDKDGVGLALSRLYMSAKRPLMPYVDSPGAAIYHKGRYGSFMGEAMEDCPSPYACVESRVNAGADRIKLIPTGIINFKKGAVTTDPQMTTQEASELVTAAQSFSKQTFAHASGDTGIDRAIDGGVDSVEHGFFIRDDQLARMRDRQIAWVPTFAPVQAQLEHAGRMGWDEHVVSNLRRILDRHAASLVKAHSLGVTIIAGSDAGSYGVPHGHGFLYELELMEKAGLSPMTVISSATGVSSGRLGFKEPFGRIVPGYLSRFILTQHSPLERLSNLRKAKCVIYDGEVLQTNEDLDPSGM